MRTGRRHEKQIRRAELFGEQNGICFYCEEPMELLRQYPIGGRLPPNACTIGRKGHMVIATCFACNSRERAA